MKKSKNNQNLIRFYFSKVHLVDRCLLLFMLVLLIQSAFSLFDATNSAGEIHTIDVIVRTSISGIFGYFLSANFIRHESSGKHTGTKTEKAAAIDNSGNAAIKNSIGFTPPASSPELASGSADFTAIPNPEPGADTTGKLQIIVATSIGLFCLVMLIVVRDLCSLQILDPSSSTFAATVSQFRDLVSGCVGFLIGCPTVVKENQ